jgi:hypothetical protein
VDLFIHLGSAGAMEEKGTETGPSDLLKALARHNEQGRGGTLRRQVAQKQKPRFQRSASKTLGNQEKKRLTQELSALGFLEGGDAPLWQVTRSVVVDTTWMALAEAHPSKGRSVWPKLYWAHLRGGMQANHYTIVAGFSWCHLS